MSVVVLAYGDEPWLERCVEAILGSVGIDIEVVLVDNGCTDGAVERLRRHGGIRHVGDGVNLGFSGGCNLGASVATGECLAFVNGDLIVEPDALEQLVQVVADPTVGIAAGSVRLATDPDLLNSAGNEIHFLGFSWVGAFGSPATDYPTPRDVAGAMGALLMLTTARWSELGGFDDHFFAFHEDADLSWRCWQSGWSVRYVPAAVGVHRYEFGRVPNKLYLAERNRLILVLTTWQTRTLILLAPAFLAMEVAVTVSAIKDRWFREKLRGWRWLIEHRRWLGERRHRLQTLRTRTDRDLAALLADHLDARNYPIPDALRPFDELLARYWRLVRHFLAR